MVESAEKAAKEPVPLAHATARPVPAPEGPAALQQARPAEAEEAVLPQQARVVRAVLVGAAG